jgi:hypothetical protein
MLAPQGVPVALSATYFDIPVMLAASVARSPLFYAGRRIFRDHPGELCQASSARPIQFKSLNAPKRSLKMR